MSPNPIPIRFYQTENGSEPVREWLKDLGRPASTIVGAGIRKVQSKWPVGLPLCRPMGDGVHEVRRTLHDDRIARILFSFHDGEMILLHGFIKKTEKTPDADLRLARERKARYEAAQG